MNMLETFYSNYSSRAQVTELLTFYNFEISDLVFIEPISSCPQAHSYRLFDVD